MAKKGYTTLNLPVDLVEELKVWRQAFMIASGRTVSYAEMIRSMLDGIGETDPAVVSAMDIYVGRHPELAAVLGRYRGVESDDEEFAKGEGEA